MKAASINHLFLLLSLFSAALSETPPGKNAIRLSNVQTLTLHADRKTTHRRVSPLPQLKCVGPSQICKLYDIDTLRCTNQGYDYDEEDIQWSCTASLPEEFKLGSTDVICEGYRNADDKWVLKGSCGVEYRLLLTEKGEQRYGRRSDEAPSKKDDESKGWVERYLFMMLFVGVCIIIIYAALNDNNGRNNRPRRRRNNNPGGPWGGDGGGGSDDDPPPPYDYQTAPQYKRSKGSGPGFWTGAAAGTAAGGAAGYAMGRRHNQQQTNAGPSYTGRDDYRDDSSSSQTFSPTRTNTGFGSTKRR